MSLSKLANLTHSQASASNNACDDDIPGDCFCIDCKQTSCLHCEKHHRKLNKDHDVILELSCADHSVQASAYCENCDIPVCMQCVTGVHQGHKIVDFNEILEKKKIFLQTSLDKIQQNIIPMLEKRRENNELEREMYDQQFKEMAKDIDEESQSQNEKIDRIKDERKKRLSTWNSDMMVFDDCTKEIKRKLDIFQRKQREYQDVLIDDSILAVINFEPDFKPLSVEIDKQDLPNPPVFHPLEMKLIKNKYAGSVQLLHRTTPIIISRFKSPVKGNPSICFANKNSMWLGGTENKELLMVNMEGVVLSTRETQNRVNALVVLHCGDIIIGPNAIDSKSVLRMKGDGSEDHVLDASPFRSAGISVTADQNLLICITDGKLVKTNSAGTNTKLLYTGSGLRSVVYAVENTDGKIYISDEKEQQIVIVSKNGDILSTLTYTTENIKVEAPLGLALDIMGNLLCADRKSHCIYIVDQNHQIRKLIGPSEGIQAPRHLAVDSAHNLWIAQYDGTILIVKYLA